MTHRGGTGVSAQDPAVRAAQLDDQSQEFWRAHFLRESTRSLSSAAAHLAGGEALEALYQARQARFFVEAMLAQAVAEARAAGHGWDRVGEALGLTGTAARGEYEGGAARGFVAEAGGVEVLARIVSRFYGKVAADDVLGPMYGEDLAGAAERLRAFLTQYWGGPRDYSPLRGHPRLQMRHAPFPINGRAREAWLRLMAEALTEEGLPAPLERMFWEYLVDGAHALTNTG
ncbi:globin [Candidatus Protofrankia californiensis]|uniref:Globin n=1 Tax=Candidatus Protofrankia californiensis TaxID=1839754 RepID=A0A1C3P070_9ACTN|nr:globin [Candidatus Protofrankia californiensis]